MSDSRLMVRLVSAASPTTTSDAAEQLSGWLSAFVTGGPAQRFSPEALRVALRSCVLPQGGPGAVTHVLRMRSVAGVSFASAVAALRVGSAPGENGELPGIELTLEISSSVDLAAAAFCKAAMTETTTHGWLGQEADLVDDVNVVSFRSEAPTRKLPMGASCEPLGHGFLLRSIGSFTDATAITSSVGTLAMALREPSLTDAFPAQVVLPPEPRQLLLSQPSHRDVAPPPLVQLQRPSVAELDPDETAPILGPLKVTDLLPFSGSTGDETLQALFRSPSPAELAPPSRSEASTDETVMLPPTAGTSGLRAGLSIPVMTVERYAELRAYLLVLGEDHEPTLQRFGLQSRDARELLKLRFVSMFATDEALRDRFVARMQELAAALRTKGTTT